MLEHTYVLVFVLSVSLSPPALVTLWKLEERSASLNKVKLADAKDREKWEKVMNLEFISSEDSGLDDGDEVLIVRSLPWRSTRVDHMFNDLDKKSLDNKLK